MGEPENKLTREDISTLLILWRGGGIENVPAKKPVSDSEIKARLQQLKKYSEVNRLVEKNKKNRAVNTLKISAYGPVKAKAESSLKESVKELSSEDESEDEKESDEDEKLLKQRALGELNG